MDLIKNIKPLSGESDWPMWKHKIRDLLDYHEGALDVIDGKLKKPEPLGEAATETQVKEHKRRSDLYRKANSYAKSMITSALTDTVYQKIMGKETASDAWEALKQQFEASAKDQLFKICIDFFSFNWNSSEDVSTHIAKLRSLWNELNNGLKIKGLNALPDLILVCKTLHLLPSKFKTFQSSWMLLTKDEDKSFDELAVQLCMFERNFTKNNSEKDKNIQEALVAKTDKEKQENKPSKPYYNNFRKEDVCHYCKKKGHWLRECRIWIAKGRPAKKNQKEVNSTESMALITLHNQEICTVEQDKETWWIDNGATRHVTNCLDYFINFEKFESPCNIKSAGKESLSALGKGSIKILSQIGNINEEIILKDVWYVPSITKNLFSVLAAHDRNLNSKFISTPTECWLKVEDKIVLYGKREVNGSLFKATIKPMKINNEINIVEGRSLLQLYHERWGHQDKRYVKKKLEKELGIKIKLNEELCESCIYGKAHRLPFGTRERKNKPGELLSADVCGPFNESFQKKRYFVIFKDSYTKYRYCYFIKEKSEVKEVLKQVLAHAKTLGHTIKEFLSDNGKEFDNEEVREILRSKGITQKLTAPYTPEQNGESERENRTIVEMARTFKYSNKEVTFPEEIWAELINTAVYILNRTGKSSEEGLTPYELWLGRKPRINHLKIIGSTCYIHIPKEKRRKMDKKALKGFLVGYDGDERYRIWISEEHKIMLSRDIQFQERPGDCEKEKETLQLPLKDFESEKIDDNLEQEKEIGSRNSISQDEFLEDRRESEEAERESVEEGEGEEEEEEGEGDSTSNARNLRNRENLNKPKYLKDYILSAEEFMNEIRTPETYEEALESKERENWRKAMESEINSLKENETWELVKKPDEAKILPSKWVFKIKTNSDGSIEKFKARLVIKGFNQKRGIDFSQTFSPVARLSTIRSVLSIAANEKMYLKQFDITTAFLYGQLEENIYMNQPEGYEDGTNRVCKLKRSLYGLKQAPRCWNKCFNNFMVKLGFKVSEADSCLYIRERNNRKILVTLYVDDGLVAATNEEDLEEFLEEIKKDFKITIKEAKYFLGLEIEKNENGDIKISQKAYTKKILERFNFSEAKSVSTPILKDSETLKSGKDESNKINFPYREAIGACMYLMVGTRPDLAYSIGILSRNLENPTNEDLIKLKRVFRYLRGTNDLGIVYHSTKKGGLECYSDADFGGCSKTGRSTSGMVILNAGGAITWQSQRQSMVAVSTTEAEIVAANEATKEIIWLSKLFEEILKIKKTPILQVDNSAAVKLAENPEFHRRTKHIGIKHFFIREKINEGKLRIQQVSSEDQVADIMTKPLMKNRLEMLIFRMGMSLIL